MILSIDLGTTGNRAIAFSKKGEMIASAYQEFTQYFPKPGWVEHDPVEILNTTLSVIRSVLTQLPKNSIQAIGITNQRETTVLWQKSTGKPLHNAIVWQCRRTEPLCNELRAHSDAIKQRTGLRLDPYFSATKIKWLIDNVPGIQDLMTQQDVAFGTIDSWILWNLTFPHVHATDHSNASRTMLLNIETLDYDPFLLNLFNIPKSILPELKSSNALFGTTTPTLVGEAIPITAILGDQQAALFAQYDPQKATIKNTYGTGLFVMCYTDTHRYSAPNLINTIAWTRDNIPRYALEGSVFIGGSAIQWLRDGLGFFTDARDSQALAESVASTDGVYLVPGFTGLGAPYWRSDVKGALLGLTRATTAAHITRATLESLAYQTRDVITEIMTAIPDFSPSYLKVDGGAVSNAFLMQFQADLLQLPVHIIELSELTAFGVAGLAGEHIQFWDETPFHSLLKTKTCIMPNRSKSEMDTLYAGWKSAVEQLLK